MNKQEHFEKIQRLNERILQLKASRDAATITAIRELGYEDYPNLMRDYNKWERNC